MTAFFNKRLILLTLLLSFSTLTTTYGQDLYPWNASISKNNSDFIISIEGNSNFNDSISFFLDDIELENIVFKNGKASFAIDIIKNKIFYLFPEGDKQHGQLLKITHDLDHPKVKKIPLWVSILPPLIAILLALLFKEVFIALFAGVWLGAFAIYGFNPNHLWQSFLYSFDFFIVNSLSDSGHVSVIVFSMMIGGMVAIISRNGGMTGVVNALSRFANNAKNAQLATWFLGVAIFFDDYANTLIVGNTMRSVTDKFKVSREKLAYIVDSTAAPIAAIGLITTWIGAELGYIQDAIQEIGLEENVYSIFLNSLKYSFYPVLTLVFILILILSNRDFGPMKKAENAARKSKTTVSNTKSNHLLEDLDPKSDIRHSPWQAIIPVLLVIGVTFYGLLKTGADPDIWNSSSSFLSKLSMVIGNSDSYTALIWASATGLASAIVLSVGGRILSPTETIDSMLVGFKTMLPTMIILILAWSLASTTEYLHTSDFLIRELGGNLSARWMPFFTFILAALISFSTGSSWSTMAILYPLILPLTWSLGLQQGIDPSALLSIFYNIVSVVLAGSVFGDHCSPISDTTVLSSLASNCNHIDHVKTQLPYAITVGIVSLFCGGVLAVFTFVPWYAIFALGGIILFFVANILGSKIEA